MARIGGLGILSIVGLVAFVIILALLLYWIGTYGEPD